MRQLRLSLDIPAHRYLAYYQGSARHIVATAHDGRRVRFPAEVLRPFLLHDGIKGEFILRYDANNRFVGIERISGR